jgi:predicted dehydrogenase
MSTSIIVQGEKGKIICDATELKIYLREANPAFGLEKGWTIKYITDYAIPVDFYLRGEEYSAQIDHFVACIKDKQASSINTFEQALYTDKVVNLIIQDSKRD